MVDASIRTCKIQLLRQCYGHTGCGSVREIADFRRTGTVRIRHLYWTFTCRFSVAFKVAVGVLSDGGRPCHRVLVTWASRLSDVKSATSFIAVIKLALVVARMRTAVGAPVLTQL